MLLNWIKEKEKEKDFSCFQFFCSYFFTSRESLFREISYNQSYTCTKIECAEQFVDKTTKFFRESVSNGPRIKSSGPDMNWGKKLTQDEIIKLRLCYSKHQRHRVAH